MHITNEQAVARLRDAAARCGGQDELARKIGMSRQYVNMALNGKANGDEVFRKALGLERVRDLWTVVK